MRIHQLLGVESSQDLQQSAQAVEIALRQKLRLSENASAETVLKVMTTLDELGAVNPFHDVFVAYGQFCFALKLQKQNSSQKEYVPVKKNKTTPECNVDPISHACFVDDWQTFETLLAQSPKYTFNHFFKVINKFTTCLREAIRHNNINMIDRMIFRDSKAITDIYRHLAHTKHTSIIPELFFCEQKTYDVIRQYFSLVDNIKPKKSIAAIKRNFLIELVNYFVFLNSSVAYIQRDEEQKKYVTQRFEQMLNIFNVMEINEFPDTFYISLRKMKAQQPEQFERLFLMFNDKIKAEIEDYLQLKKNKVISQDAISTEAVNYDFGVETWPLGENHFDFWQSKKTLAQDQTIESDLDMNEEQAAKKAKTDFWKPKSPLTFHGFQELSPLEQQEEIEGLKFLEENQEQFSFLTKDFA